jgi:hypothetical protein
LPNFSKSFHDFDMLLFNECIQGISLSSIQPMHGVIGKQGTYRGSVEKSGPDEFSDEARPRPAENRFHRSELKQPALFKNGQFVGKCPCIVKVMGNVNDRGGSFTDRFFQKASGPAPVGPIMVR